MIRIENVSLRIRATPILRDINLTIPKGGVVALIGPNGAGKSSLLSLIARLRPLQQGTIHIDGLPVDRTPGPELARVVAILRQDSTVASRLKVRELVGFGRFPHGRGRLTAADLEIVDQALARFELTDLADRFLETLSGGQRQRALVAMAFAQDTDYLLLDEPLNNLDMHHARELMRSLRAIAVTRARTVVIVLHDVNQASAYADRIVAMQNGCIIADAAPLDLLTPDTLETVFGFRMRVEIIAGKPFVLHHL
ncbi:ATP-binding cassette domain-containing protein [Rhizobium sp. YJ-22]|uniref:iron ABC transporter ATP-binding protein n=1 Tax=Rhizobium sp. YJ-22 TaxID=3037556 RepID=UPI002412E658|nr:ATP-binding cassette domain-containing protein [Rhizobium sp. YJ-22]MDG3579423.1 ATP-binding cassette domain-containing protein [Rhizobium sp. YJ-22]